MTRTAALVFLFALAAGVVRAEAAVGGGNMTIAHSAGGAGGGGPLQPRPARSACFARCHGDGPMVEYLPPSPADPGREAWMVGGGDNAEVADGRRR